MADNSISIGDNSARLLETQREFDPAYGVITTQLYEGSEASLSTLHAQFRGDWVPATDVRIPGADLSDAREDRTWRGQRRNSISGSNKAETLSGTEPLAPTIRPWQESCTNFCRAAAKAMR
jgi:hypothetical protein